MWYEILFRVLSIINYIVLIIIAIPILLQLFYVCAFFVKKKTFPVSEKKGRIAYLIPAHNEADVIFNTVKSIIEGQKYPREKFDVFVVAHNCTDETARLAREAGATVLELNDPDPARRMEVFPLKYGIAHILDCKEDPYDFIVRIDADNHINEDFSSLMNDAYQSGVDFARPYEGAINATQNFYTKAGALFYSFDSRFASRVRERLGLAAHVNGPGAMMSVKMLKASGGYDCETISEDAEFNLKRMYDGYKGHFVEDAVVYEDMPSSFKDTLTRNRRMGGGAMDLFKKNAFPMICTFFRTGNFSFLEVFCLYMLNLLNVVIGIWFPLYYVYHFLFCGFAAYGYLPLTMFSPDYYCDMIFTYLIVAACILLALFIIFGYLQALILVLTDYKKLGAKNRRELLPAVFMFPLFIILYATTFFVGATSKSREWGKIQRNINE